MPEASPQIGEVWRYQEQEAIIVSLSVEAARLMARNGHKVFLPLRSLNLLWSPIATAPQEPRICERDCESEALFHYSLDGRQYWVCDNHVPHGVDIRFHCDPPGEVFNPGPCPACGQSNEGEDPLDLFSVESRVYVRKRCTSCEARWFSIVHSHLAAIDTALHIPSLADTFPVGYHVEIHCGDSAYNDLKRAVGTELKHFHGVPVRRTSRYGSANFYIIGTVSPMTLSPRSERPVYEPLNLPQDIKDQLERQAEHVGPVMDDAVPSPGTFWRRRRNDNTVILCQVFGITHAPQGDAVVYDIVHDPTKVLKHGTMYQDQFLDHWTLVRTSEEAQTPVYYLPPVGSYWQDIEARNVVRVEGITDQNSNPCVDFRSAKGGNAPTGVLLQTFSRLYRELPYPPGDALWADPQGIVHWVSAWSGSEGYNTIKVEFQTLGGPPKYLVLPDFYEEMVPLALETSVPSLRSQPLTRGAVWEHEGRSFEIRDFALSDYPSVRVVRFTGEDLSGFPTYTHRGLELAILPIHDFKDTFTCTLPPPPCEEGQRWESLDGIDTVILKVDLTHRRALLREDPLNPTRVGWVNFEDLEEGYRKLDIKSVWEILDEDD